MDDIRSEGPTVSVVIPTRNCLTWLPRAIASIGARADTEVIVVDDGSTDGTDAWLARAQELDPRIRVLTGSGGGPATSRNIAIEAATAPLIAFLDADDQWYPGKLDIQLAAHARWPEIGFSFTDYRHVTMDGEDRGSCFAFWPRFAAYVADRHGPFVMGGDALARIYAENVVGTSTVIARTDLLRKLGCFSTDLPSSEDWDLWLRLASRAPVLCVPHILAEYLMHRPGNETRRARARVLAMRVIGARYRNAVRAIDRSAIAVMSARILTADAELQRADGRLWKAAALMLAALVRSRSRRALREAAAAALSATRQTLRAIGRS